MSNVIRRHFDYVSMAQTAPECL